MGKWLGWFKAKSVQWEMVITEGRANGCGRNLATLDLSYLEQTDQDLTISQLGDRWGWSRSKVHRFVNQAKKQGGTKAKQKRDDSGTDKPATVASVRKTAGQERDDSGTKTKSATTLYKELELETENVEPKKESAAKRTGRLKREGYAVWFEEHRRVFGRAYTQNVTDGFKWVSAFIGERVADDPDEFRRVVATYLEEKKRRPNDFIGACPKGAPSMTQLVKHYNEFLNIPKAPVRGRHSEDAIVEKKHRDGPVWSKG